MEFVKNHIIIKMSIYAKLFIFLKGSIAQISRPKSSKIKQPLRPKIQRIFTFRRTPKRINIIRNRFKFSQKTMLK